MTCPRPMAVRYDLTSKELSFTFGNAMLSAEAWGDLKLSALLIPPMPSIDGETKGALVLSVDGAGVGTIGVYVDGSWKICAKSEGAVAKVEGLVSGLTSTVGVSCSC